jgi:hypothetical protein
MVMPIENIDDWERRLARQDAFWSCAIIDRPVVCFSLHHPNPDYPWPKQRVYESVRDSWMDAEYIAERTVASVMNTEYWGDALPHVFPNLGPEIFSAFFGCELEYSRWTSWSVPNLDDWDSVSEIRFSKENPYWIKLEELTDALLEAGRGRFYTGITDLHPGGDAIAAFRDPMRLNYDMIDAVDEVKSLLRYVNEVYFLVYDYYHKKLTDAGQAICSWPGIVSTKKWYVPSNDFSCMISDKMFDDVFLQGIVEECKHMEASIYHLDGPNALRYLDRLLAIKELNAIQWVYGEGNGRASDWIDVYKRCQKAGKGVQISIGLDELDFFMSNLRPEGVWLSIYGIGDRTQAEEVLRRIAMWR